MSEEENIPLPGEPAAANAPQPSETAKTNPPRQNNGPLDPDQPLSTDNMEVHHHPQLSHKHKPWKEYLLEGLMIFIAVMLGFISENIREEINNKRHVRELTSQLVQDLKADTLQLNGIYQEELKIFNANDSLIHLLQQPPDKENTERIQRLIVYSHNIWLFHPSAGAIGAIKNELHLKQFSGSKIISYISEYEKHIELLHTVQDITLRYQRTFIDPFLLRHFTVANLDAAFHQLPLLNPEMRNLSPDDLTQLAADMVLVKINTKELVDDNGEVKNDAARLLQYVKAQYNPDKE
jgi:hypothetical protein